ncbi:MAG TPA: hypothetical protein VH867_05845 [Burkholderiales bacterium]|jgi:hypothetical protein
MATELDELATRASNDPSLSGTELGGLIVSVIKRTRRYWAIMSDQHLPPEAVIGVGIGYAALTRDGQPVYEESGKRQCELMTVAQAEELARHEPEHDWRIHLVAQLENRHYRRTGAGLWEIYERGSGMS